MDLKLNNDRKKLSEYSRISKLQFEVQIRSIVQDAWSEVDHKLKYKKSLSDDLQRKIVVLASLFELADREFDSIRVAAINEFEERIVAEQNQHKAVINVFNLLSFLKVKFEDFQFEDYKLEGFVEEILTMKIITIGDFIKAYEAHYENVTKYKEYREDLHGDRINPYTFLRHILYLNNARLFNQILFDMQRENFSKWLGKIGK